MAERSCVSCHHRFDERDLAELADGTWICEGCDSDRLAARFPDQERGA